MFILKYKYFDSLEHFNFEGRVGKFASVIIFCDLKCFMQGSLITTLKIIHLLCFAVHAMHFFLLQKLCRDLLWGFPTARLPHKWSVLREVAN